jgi:hypothetical protein
MVQQSLRNLQIFRNGELLTGSIAYVKDLINGAFTGGDIVLNDGEPISIRYKEEGSDEIKSLFGVAYVPANGTPSILWTPNPSDLVLDTNGDKYVTLNYVVGETGNYTLTVAAQIADPIGSEDGKDGLVTASLVKTYVDDQLSAFSPDAITAVEGGTTDFVSVSVSDKDTDGKVVVTADVTTAETIDNEGLATASLVKSYVEDKITEIEIPTVPEYTIKSIDVENDSLKTYQLFKGGVAVEGSKINIPKDYLVKDASIKTVETENEPEEGYKVGDKYFDFVINTKEGTTEDQHLYINAKDLVDTYTAGKDISITDNNAINVSLSNAITPNTTVGFVSPSNPIPAGASLEDVLRKILVKEVLATKVNPTNSLTVSGDAQREVGTALGTITLTPSYTDGYYKSSDTAVYTNTQFNTNNDTTNGRLNAGCTPGAITYYKGTAIITDQVSEDYGFQYVDNTTTTKNETYSFQITTAYEASTVNECKTSSNAVQEISIDGGTTSKSDAKTVKFYHKTYVSPIQGLVWDAANNYLVKNGVEYVPSDELKNTMSEAGAFLTTTGQYKSETYTIPGTSSLCVIVPQNVTFSTYSTSDNNKTNLFGNFKKYETTNNLGITYDIYIYTNNGSAEFAVTGLTYSNIE